MPPLDESAWADTVQLVPSGICAWGVQPENGSIGAGGGIDIEDGGKTSTELYTRGDPAAPVLFAFIGDADED